MHRFARCALHSRALSVKSLAHIQPLPHRTWTRSFADAFPRMAEKEIQEREEETIEPQDQEQIAAFLAICPQNVSEFAEKFNSWPHLLNATNRQLKGAGLNVKQRKGLLEKLEVYKSEHRRRTMINQLPTINASAGPVEAQQALFDIEYAHIYARQWRKAEEREAAHWWRQQIIMARLRKKWTRNEWNGINQSNLLPSLKPLRNPEAAKALLKEEIAKLEEMVEEGEDEELDALNIIEDEVLNELHLEPFIDVMYEERRKQILTTETVDEYESSIIDATAAAICDPIKGKKEKEVRENLIAMRTAQLMGDPEELLAQAEENSAEALRQRFDEGEDVDENEDAEVDENEDEDVEVEQETEETPQEEEQTPDSVEQAHQSWLNAVRRIQEQVSRMHARLDVIKAAAAKLRAEGDAEVDKAETGFDAEGETLQAMIAELDAETQAAIALREKNVSSPIPEQVLKIARILEVNLNLHDDSGMSVTDCIERAVKEVALIEDVDQHVREYLGDVDDPMVDQLYEMGVPVKSWADRMTKFDIDEMVQERLDEGETDAEAIREEILDEIHEEETDADLDELADYMGDEDRPLHPVVEYSLKQKIRDEFWTYNASADYHYDKVIQTKFPDELEGVVQGEVPMDTETNVSDVEDPLKASAELRDTLAQLKQWLTDLKAEYPDQTQDEAASKLEEELTEGIAEIDAELNASPEDQLHSHLESIGIDQESMVAMEREARRDLTLEGLHPKSVEDEDELIADVEPEVPEYTRDGTAGEDISEIIDEDDYNMAEDEDTEWPMLPEEEVRDFIMNDTDVEQSDHDEQVGIVKPDVAARRALFAEEDARTETASAARDQRLSDEQLKKINQRRLARMFKLEDEYQPKQ